MSAAVALPASEMLDVKGAAEYLKMSVHWVYKQSAAGVLPCVKLGRCTRFRKEDLDAWVKSRAEGRG